MKKKKSPMSRRKSRARYQATYAAAVLGGCVIEQWKWSWGDGARLPKDLQWKLNLPPDGRCDQVRYASKYQASCAGIDYLTGKKEFVEPRQMPHGNSMMQYLEQSSRMLRRSDMSGVEISQRYMMEHTPIDEKVLQAWSAKVAENVDKLVYDSFALGKSDKL